MLDPLIEVGFYGKLPSHGDFLRRRTPEAFVDVWDAWLQECISASRQALGDRWLDVYLTSPVWRFAAAPGICGPAAVAGVMVPSVDRVGRYFPLTVVAALPPYVDPLSAATAADYFFERAERLVIETLEADDVDFDGFDVQVAELTALLDALAQPPVVILDPGALDELEPGSGGVQIPLGTSSQLSAVLTQLLSQRLSSVYQPLMLWWTGGSAAVDPSCLMMTGLPRPDSFAAFLDGEWAARQWRPVAAQVDAIAATDDTLVTDGVPLTLRSAAASDVGRVRSINQDSFLERPEVGIWVVADGLGGHSDGEVASRMVCDAFADLVPESSFENMIETAAERMHQVNDQLIRASERSLLGVRCGSTVAALLVRGNRLAIVWAGDSRVYRWRTGQLQQLTRDHSLEEAEGLPGGSSVSNVVTRAVGGEPTLLLDVYRDQVRAGDRYLLCSDGLTRTLPDDRIAVGLAQEDLAIVVKDLIMATLAAGAPDNVTVLVVEAAAA